MKELMIKIIKKLHLQKIAYALCMPFVQKNDHCNLVDARQRLEAFSPDPVGCAHVQNRILEPECDLTIIIPAYNVEIYIEECLNSVVNQQTKYSFRVVVVNDGSTDLTGNVLEQYSIYDSITILTKKNGGAAKARNCALEHIKSKYLMFLDADDVLEPGAIDVLMNKAITENADIVEGGYYTFTGSDKKYHAPMCDAGIYNSAYGVISGFTCMKVLKSDLFASVVFPEGYWFEDSIMAMIIFPQVKRAVRINDVVYGYRMNQSGSTAQVKKSVKSVDSYWIVEQLLKDLATMNIPVTNEIYQQLLHQGQLCYLRNQNQPKDIQEALFILFSDLLKRNYTRIEANDPWLLKLEQSLLTCNYTQYRLVCTLME